MGVNLGQSRSPESLHTHREPFLCPGSLWGQQRLKKVVCSWCLCTCQKQDPAPEAHVGRFSTLSIFLGWAVFLGTCFSANFPSYAQWALAPSSIPEIEGEYLVLWLLSVWSLDDTIEIQCAVYFIRWKSTHWGIISFPRVTLWQRVAALHIKMIKAWLKSLAA